MFKLNLKIAFRSIYKYKVYTIINVVGLALGLAGIVFILLFINYEKSYNSWSEELKNVYQVQELDLYALKEGRADWWGESDVRLVDQLKINLPNVVAVTTGGFGSQERSLTIGDQEPFLIKDIFSADSAFFSVFPYRFLHGDGATALQGSQAMVITEDFARKHFGTSNPLGQVVMLDRMTGSVSYTITGVIERSTMPTTLHFSVLISAKQFNLGGYYLDFRPTYIRFEESGNSQDLNLRLQRIYHPFAAAVIRQRGGAYSDYSKNGLHPAIRLKSFYSLHQDPPGKDSWLSTLKPVIFLSSLLLLISVINFINMFTAQASSRAKEVGIRKVAGASRTALIFQFLVETWIQCFFALLLGVIVLELCLPYLNEQFALSLSITSSPQPLWLALQLMGLVFVISLLAGFYPALILSAYEAQQVLKGNFAQGRIGLTLRNVLVSAQFVIAVSFLIGIMIISRQLDFLQSRDLGFDPKGVIYLKDGMLPKEISALRKIDGLQYIGSNSGTIHRDIQLTGKYKYKEEEKEIVTVLVNNEGLQAIGAKLLSGRFFDLTQLQDTLNKVIINERLEKEYGGHMLGKWISYQNDSVHLQVIGVVRDIQTFGFDREVAPAIYTTSVKNATEYPNRHQIDLIRYDQDKEKQVLSELRKLWKRLSPHYPLNYVYLEDDYRNLFVAHERFGKMVATFSMLSIFLSLMGLFALTAYMTRIKCKEIAIRKVLGSSDATLFLLLNKHYLALMFTANLISWPLIYVAMQHWLNGFVYRIEFSVWPFVLTFFISMLTTAITVTLQVREAVEASTVDALKYE